MDKNWDKQCLNILVENWDSKELLLRKVALKILSENPIIFYKACKKLGLVRKDFITKVIEACKEEGITNINNREAERLINAISIGKIPGIKEFRSLFGSGLIEAKFVVEKIMSLQVDKDE